MLSHLYPEIKKELRANLKLSIPITLSQIVGSCSGFITTAMVGVLGQDALAATVLVSLTWWAILVLFFGILNSVSVLVSHQYGAGNDKAISKIMGQAHWLCLIMCAVQYLVLWMVPHVIALSHQPSNVLHLATINVHSLMWTVPQFIAFIFYEQFLTGIGHTRVVMWVSIIIVPIEVFLLYGFILGHWGLPKYGVAGIGYGLACSWTLVSIFLIGYLYFKPEYKTFAVFAEIFSGQWNYLKEMFRIGLPMGGMQFIEVSAFTMITYWMARFGTIALAAHQITFQYLGLLITFVFAMSQAVSIRVGHEVGAQNKEAVMRATFVGLGLNVWLMAIIALALFFWPQYFIKLDIHELQYVDPQLITYAENFLSIIAVLMMFESFRIVGYGVLRALKDTKFAMFSSFIGFWVFGLSFAYYFAFNLDEKGSGLWWGLTAGIAFTSIIIIARLIYLLPRVDLKKLMV